MKKNYWIWYPGDFELYHAMKQNFSRVERGMGWPAFWKSEGFRNRVAFRRTYHLKEETSFLVYSEATGYALAGEKKYPFGSRILCGPGELSVSIHAACIEKFPAVYIEGDAVCSDVEWMAEDYDGPPVPVGYSKYFTRADQVPSEWVYDEKRYEPVLTEEASGGVLCEFETELTAQIEVRRILHTESADKAGKIRVCCGESREEALDQEHCYYSWEIDPVTHRSPRCAVRFVFLPQCKREEISVSAIHQYVDIPVKASFWCDDELLNQIWAVAGHTFRLCSGIFFIDGIKRDKWIWGGDAYQSLFVNQYLMADPDINRRTLLALRGNDPMTTHINTIADYSLLWILSVKAHYEAYADEAFLRQVYPKMVSLINFCEGQLDKHGFLIGRKKDWIYIDWADLDKEGPLCAEQMLLAACYQVMEEMGKIAEDGESVAYHDKYREMVRKIDRYYWDEEQSAYIDSFLSGKRHVTRHANIFAILYGIADTDRQRQIMESVLLNDKIPAITTPYFKFYELDVLCRMGKFVEVLGQIKSYWGGMLERGAVTFWEEYDPNVPKEEQYDMYGDKFGKSLCHAWAASPIYLLAKYFVGVHILKPGGEQYEVRPQMEFFRKIDCTVPVGMHKLVHIYGDTEHLNIEEI